MLKKYLISPGPTPVKEEILLEMAKPVMHHRTDEFSKIFSEARNALGDVFGTSSEVLILLGSGTAAMEAAVVNTLNSGDKVLIVNGGKFGERWISICNSYSLDVHTVDIPWGKSVSPGDIEKFLKDNADTKAVLMQSSETSTTVYHPVEEIGSILSSYKDTLFVVDGITSVGVHPMLMDEWGVDILVSGSQKAFMLPPGLAFIALSNDAWLKTSECVTPRYYLDLKRELKNQVKDTTAYTPGVSLIYGLKKVMEMLYEEGLPNVFKRHKVNAEATRAAINALGLKPLAEDLPSNAATGFYLPEDVDGNKFLNAMNEKVGITFAGGQDQLKGKIVRISHLGYHSLFDVIIAISALEMGLRRFGVEIELGSGIRAAEEILQEHIGI